MRLALGFCRCDTLCGVMNYSFGWWGQKATVCLNLFKCQTRSSIRFSNMQDRLHHCYQCRAYRSKHLGLSWWTKSVLRKCSILWNLCFMEKKVQPGSQLERHDYRCTKIWKINFDHFKHRKPSIGCSVNR